MPKMRRGPWYYYQKERMPGRKLLEGWRKEARRRARARGFVNACSFCKVGLSRPETGKVIIKPCKGRHYQRQLCDRCGVELRVLLDVMEWVHRESERGGSVDDE